MFSRGARAIADFDAWLNDLPQRHKVIVLGNHEFFLEKYESPRTAVRHARILMNESIEIEGLRIWGSHDTVDERRLWNGFCFQPKESLRPDSGQHRCAGDHGPSVPVDRRS
jgi:hypothetical protein